MNFTPAEAGWPWQSPAVKWYQTRDWNGQFHFPLKSLQCILWHIGSLQLYKYFFGLLSNLLTFIQTNYALGSFQFSCNNVRFSMARGDAHFYKLLSATFLQQSDPVFSTGRASHSKRISFQTLTHQSRPSTKSLPTLFEASLEVVSLNWQ